LGFAQGEGGKSPSLLFFLKKLCILVLYTCFIYSFIMTKKADLKRGFTLIESLLAIGVLIVGILSAFILVVRSLSNIPLIQSRLVAANLAQEGIELVRQKRDTNNLIGVDWKTGFDLSCICSDDPNVVLDSGCYYMTDTENRTLSRYSGEYLRLEEVSKNSWKYNYNPSGTEYPYFIQRKIEICFVPRNLDGGFNEMRVKAFLYWKVKKNNFSLIVEDHLFNYFSADNF